MHGESAANVLRSLGLAGGTERVYLAMLDHPEVDVDELAHHVDLPVDQMRAELDRMVELGLVRRSATPDIYLAVPPDQAVEVLIARTQETIDSRRAAIDEARDQLPTLVETYLTKHAREVPDGRCEELQRGSLVQSRLYQLNKDARRRMRFMAEGAGFTAERTEISRRLDADLLARGVQLQILSSSDNLRASHWRSYLEETAASGADVRVHDSLPMLAVIVDDEVAVLPKADAPGAWVLHGADVVAPSVALFESTWREALPIAEALAAPSGPNELLTPRQRQVLHLLADGHTDEVIARRMKCSSRTVGRLVSEVCSALQAQSRFQAGVLAATRGWLTGDR